MTIERNYDIGFVAALALKEKQIQQNYRPIIAVHKWFARRPGTLFRALTLAEFSNRPVAETFFQAHDFSGRQVADPFMGGGTPLIEANRVGCDVQGYDINPMAARIVREEIEHLDLPAYRHAAGALLAALRADLDRFYRTDCPHHGDRDVPVKYFIWVKEIDCADCGGGVPLFPGYRLADATRHPAHVILCHRCHALVECPSATAPGACPHCHADLVLDGPAGRNRCACPSCGHVNRYPRPDAGPPRHRLVAIEYHNPRRKPDHRGRFFKTPDDRDTARVQEIERLWAAHRPVFVPDQDIPPGDETDRLHRWGYRRYRDLFNARQLYGLEKSAACIAAIDDRRIRQALATNLSDLLRYQNMLCRYDTMALKSLDIFSVHGFPVGLMPVESNLFGIVTGSGVTVGSGGWSNIIEKYTRAKRYCDAPFEVRRQGRKTVRVPIVGEWIGERRSGHRPRKIAIHCANATEIDIAPGSLDAVFTDPPYFGNVQYGELMDFCYVWLRALLGSDTDGFAPASARTAGELTGNQTQGRTLDHFTDGLAAVYATMARALKPGAPLAFTFHHNRLDAYQAIGVAILDAGLTCSASLPCPAEMGGSIHIHGTGSSIVDSVFVCRSTGAAPADTLCRTAGELAALVARERAALTGAGMTPRKGDIRCITLGHLTRLAIWRLRDGWERDRDTTTKLERFGAALKAFGEPDDIVASAEASDLPRQDFGALSDILPERAEAATGTTDIAATQGTARSITSNAGRT